MPIAAAPVSVGSFLPSKVPDLFGKEAAHVAPPDYIFGLGFDSGKKEHPEDFDLRDDFENREKSKALTNAYNMAERAMDEYLYYE